MSATNFISRRRQRQLVVNRRPNTETAELTRRSEPDNHACSGAATATPTLHAIADHEAMLDSFFFLRSNGGQAPGPDGIGYYDRSISEIAARLRGISSEILVGRYRPGPSKIVPTPKASGGTRELRLRSIFDRIVSRTVNDALVPMIDPHFLECSYAYRPRRSVHRLLVDLERSVTFEGRTWIVQDDVRKAFDRVDIADLLADVARHINDPGLLDLIEKIIRGPDVRHTHGIEQGDPLSPLLLNIHLHYRLDVPLHVEWRNGGRYYRYCDNIIFAGVNESECRALILATSEHLGAVDLELKGETPKPINLRVQGAWIELLGYRISLGDTREAALRLAIGQKAIDNLENNLRECWLTPNPAENAKQTVMGWIDAYGPALGDAAKRNDHLRRIRQTLRRCDIREGIRDELLLEGMRCGHERWLQLRTQARRDSGGPT